MNEEVPPDPDPSARAADAQPDLPLSAMWVGAGILAAVTVLFVALVPLPRLFAKPGEDRSLIEPADPAAYAVYRKAKAGDPEAMNSLAVYYLQGQGVAPDAVAAARWLRAAVDAGHVAAMYNLGTLSQSGQGTPRDDAYAFRLFDRAAQGGHAPAMVQLAVHYATGRGVGADRSTAVYWLQRAYAAALPGDDATRRAAAEVMRQLGP